MSLDYNYKKVQDSDTLMFDEDDRMRPQSESLIFATIFIGMNEITEKNYEEFFVRLSMFERAFGSLVRKSVDGNLEDFPFTLDVVKAHIGLHTNASRLTMPQFKKQITERLEEEARRKLR